MPRMASQSKFTLFPSCRWQTKKHTDQQVRSRMKRNYVILHQPFQFPLAHQRRKPEDCSFNRLGDMNYSRPFECRSQHKTRQATFLRCSQVLVQNREPISH